MWPWWLTGISQPRPIRQFSVSQNFRLPVFPPLLPSTQKSEKSLSAATTILIRLAYDDADRPFKPALIHRLSSDPN